MATRSTQGPPSLATLFLSFLTIGSTSFGGGLLGWIRRELVERRGWIDDQQFLVFYGISQMVPERSRRSPDCCWRRSRSCLRSGRCTLRPATSPAAG
jgi:Chromate transporter